MSSNRSLEATLESLLPGWTNGPIPSSLVELAASLLAQSRSKASAFKAEEEIGRSYACAHLAAERLKQRLNLPKIEARPPCPPKVYKKLYTYLDRALPAKRAAATGKEPAPSTPAKQTKSRPTNPPTTSAKKRRLNGSHRVNSVEKENNLPEWVLPTIRRLCKELRYPAAVPHTLAGVGSIMQPLAKSVSGRAMGKSKENNSLVVTDEMAPALIVAVLVRVVDCMVGLDDDEQATVVQAAADLLVDSDVAPDRATLDLQAEVMALLDQERQQDTWSKMDWLKNIPSAAADQGDNDVNSFEEDEGESRGRARTPSPSAVVNPAAGGSLQIGLGTMMQERIDWLSDERRRDYATWKAGIMAKIEQIERMQGQETGGMETD